MAKKVLVPLADGCEELEAIAIIDVLRRADLDVCLASVMDGRTQVTSAHGVKLDADCGIDSCTGQTWDLIALPGGMPGAENLHDSNALMTLVKAQLAEQRWLGAICASPAVVLGRHQLLKDHVATCYPAFQEELAGQAKKLKQDRVVIDGKLITSQGPGTATEFALHLVAQLLGKAEAQDVADAMLVKEF